MKQCVTCKLKKELLDFNKNKTKPDGFQNECRACSNIRSKFYYDKDPSAHRLRVSKRKSKLLIWLRDKK